MKCKCEICNNIFNDDEVVLCQSGIGISPVLCFDCYAKKEATIDGMFKSNFDERKYQKILKLLSD